MGVNVPMADLFLSTLFASCEGFPLVVVLRTVCEYTRLCRDSVYVCVVPRSVCAATVVNKTTNSPE